MSHEIVVHQTYKEEGRKGPKRLYINVNGKLINNHIAVSSKDITRIKKNYESSFGRAFTLIQ